MQKFSQIQEEFARAIRKPESYRPVNKDEARRLHVYQSLFFNNVEGFLLSGFPVLKDVLTQSQWDTLAKTFFAEHHARSPYFVDIAKEFVEFLSASSFVHAELPDFVSELAHYEWLELDLSVRKQSLPEKPVSFDPDMPLVLSPLAALVSYRYPVHRIGADFLPDTHADPQERHYYVVYRDADDDVQFIYLNPVTALLLNLYDEADQGLLPGDVQKRLMDALPHLSPDMVMQGTLDTLRQMVLKQVLIAESH
ncbi:HvfC family RiPP maturation protein [Alteromonas sp. CYL-A6]|uniref:HvfC family RiPP maturation protein n=1 Tax=Alteromonas nitratireducens TaxID=3390813 RepID=UPI0034B756AE